MSAQNWVAYPKLLPENRSQEKFIDLIVEK